MAKKNGQYYFDMFDNLVNYSYKAALSLRDTLNSYDSKNLEQKMESMHQIEHEADGGQHELLKKLAAEFIPPIEREDIVSLAGEIDEVTDSIEDVLLRIYMYNIQSIRDDALEFAELIVKCCEALKHTMEEFRRFKKSELIHNYIIEVNRLEEEADRLYMDAVRSLVSSESANPLQVFVWSEVFNRMEKCCDECEHVANVVESVIMKNS